MTCSLVSKHRRRAVSPVIATVILVAIAITISIAVSYWTTGVLGAYHKFEKVEIHTATCTYSGNPAYAWTVNIELKNTGNIAATITSVYLNNFEVSQYGASGPVQGQVTCSIGSSEYVLQSGERGLVTLWIRGPDTSGVGGFQSLSPGTSVRVILHSANGMDYSKMFELV